MDIEGAEYQAFQGIKPFFKQITGIVLEIHFSDTPKIEQAARLLEMIDKQFVLVHLHGNNGSQQRHPEIKRIQGKLSPLLELSYVHKSLLKHTEKAPCQNHPQSMDMPNIPSRPDVVFTVLDGV